MRRLSLSSSLALPLLLFLSLLSPLPTSAYPTGSPICSLSPAQVLYMPGAQEDPSLGYRIWTSSNTYWPYGVPVPTTAAAAAEKGTAYPANGTVNTASVAIAVVTPVQTATSPAAEAVPLVPTNRAASLPSSSSSSPPPSSIIQLSFSNPTSLSSSYTGFLIYATPASNYSRRIGWFDPTDSRLASGPESNFPVGCNDGHTASHATNVRKQVITITTIDVDTDYPIRQLNGFIFNWQAPSPTDYYGPIVFHALVMQKDLRFQVVEPVRVDADARFYELVARAKAVAADLADQIVGGNKTKTTAGGSSGSATGSNSSASAASPTSATGTAAPSTPPPSTTTDPSSSPSPSSPPIEGTATTSSVPTAAAPATAATTAAPPASGGLIGSFTDYLTQITSQMPSIGSLPPPAAPVFPGGGAPTATVVAGGGGGGSSATTVSPASTATSSSVAPAGGGGEAAGGGGFATSSAAANDQAVSDAFATLAGMGIGTDPKPASGSASTSPSITTQSPPTTDPTTPPSSSSSSSSRSPPPPIILNPSESSANSLHPTAVSLSLASALAVVVGAAFLHRHG